MERVVIGEEALDRPVWSALTSAHAPLALVRGRARRYPAIVSRFAALDDASPEAFADLAALVEPGERIMLLSTGPYPIPAAWTKLVERFIDQMVQTGPQPAAVPGDPPLRLAEADVPDMIALTKLTEPGPFAPHTIGMGRYFGHRDPGGRLIAMAGERMRLDGFTEVSAVATHPDARGRGLAAALVAHMTGLIRAEGKTPFLHVLTENPAKALYQRLGFVVRRPVQLTVISHG